MARHDDDRVSTVRDQIDPLTVGQIEIGHDDIRGRARDEFAGLRNEPGHNDLEPRRVLERTLDEFGMHLIVFDQQDPSPSLEDFVGGWVRRIQRTYDRHRPASSCSASGSVNEKVVPCPRPSDSAHTVPP